MAQSQASKVDSSGGVDAASNAMLSDRVVSFRFAVTLKSLSIPLESWETTAEAPQSIAFAKCPPPIAVAPFAPPASPAISADVSAVITPSPRVVPEPSTSPPPPVVTESSTSATPPDVSEPAHGATDFMPVAKVRTVSPGLPWELAAPEFHLETMLPTELANRLRAFKKQQPR